MGRVAPLLFQTTARLAMWVKSPYSEGLRRVFAAGVVNREFCYTLLQDPSTALGKGYLGETFDLTPDERTILVSIRAKSLSDLARQMNRSLLEKE